MHVLSCELLERSDESCNVNIALCRFPTSTPNNPNIAVVLEDEALTIEH